MADIINIQPVNPNNFQFQNISTQDTNILTEVPIEGVFDPYTSTVEFYIYDYNKNILVTDYNFTNWKLDDNGQNLNLNSNTTALVLDPKKDVESYGYGYGQVYTSYNFLQKELSSSPENLFFINEISSDRTEVRIDNINISNESLEILFNDFYSKFKTGPTFDYFYLNFLNNDLLISTNIYLDKSTTNYSILVKLYAPLPPQFGLKSQCLVNYKIADSVAYLITFDNTVSNIDDIIQLQGPNTNLNIKDELGKVTDYQNYINLTSTVNTSSLDQLKSLLADQNIEINVDYREYENFIFLSSAQSRLSNFYYKAKQIEDYNNELTTLSSTSYNTSGNTSVTLLEQYITNIIENFDGYEYFLYFNSESKAWPKTNTTPPYNLASTGSVAVLNWYGSDIYGAPYYGGQSYSASLYDTNNQNLITNTIPDYLNDYDSEAYFTFSKMIGQSFDNIWVYIKSITDKSNTDNRLDYGAPSGLVADILKSFGFKLYTNNFSSDDTYSALLGIGANGVLYPTGSELITNYISASTIPIPLEEVNLLTYKRIYHNLPYLLKKKGTLEGLKSLITLYGIPDTILEINEFGGQDKSSTTVDDWQDEYNYTLLSTANASSSVNIPFKNLNTNYGGSFPRAIELRFKPGLLPTSNIPRSQSIIAHTSNGLSLTLEYTGSGYTTGSYSGAPINPYYQYASLKFRFSSGTAEVYLPFFNGEWWSILINADTTTDTLYTLYAGSKTEGYYNGITYEASSSFTDPNFWDVIPVGNLVLNSSSVSSYTPFTGSYQEFRYYNVPLDKKVFDSYVLNPYSIEGNTINGAESSKNSLAFRLALGGELFTGSTSIHPGITGSTFVTQSFFAAPYTASFRGTTTYLPNVETFYFNQVPVGIQTTISNKIKQQGIILPYSSSLTNIPNPDVLSPFISVQQKSYISSSYSADVNYTEIAFSPQNIINNDITEQLGSFNIGNYIGDPRQISSSALTYPDLDTLRNTYFEKYDSNYDVWDYVRLIKYFDNSLFKTIKDFIPARTSLASGIVVKQTLLERNRYPVPQTNISTSIANVALGSTNVPFYQQDILFTGSITVETIEGGNGGTLPNLNGQTSSVILDNNYDFTVTQVWSGSNIGPLGPIPFIDSYQYEFFDGEFSGSELVVTTQSLNPDNILLSNQAFYPTIGDYQNLNVNTNKSISGSGIFTSIIPFDTLQRNINYYNTSTYQYAPTFDTVSDISFYITASIIVTGSAAIGNFPLYLTLYENNNEIANSILFYYGLTGFPLTKYVTESIIYPNIPIKSGSIYTTKINNITSLSSITASFNLLTNWTVNVVNPQVIGYPNDPNIYQQSTFPGDLNLYPNYNAILNNTISNRLSTKYFDVDYTQNGVLPINQEVIISQSAVYAQVQDSNYTLARNINPRYNGCKNTSAQYNIYTIGDTSFGKKASIDKGTRFGIYFDDGRAHEPELPYKTTFQILFLFDEDGNTYNPSLTGSYYDNMILAFGKDTKCNIILREPGLVNTQIIDNFQGEKNVYFPLYNFLSPLTTQSGSSWSQTTMSFTATNNPAGGDLTLPQPPVGGWWLTSSASDRNILTSSLLLGYLFAITNTTSSNRLNVVQINPSGTGSRSGFGGYPDDILPLTVNQYDTIRFNTGYDDYSQDYLIISSSYDNITPTASYFLFLDRPVGGNTNVSGSVPINLSKFTILNRLPNQQRIFVDAYKPPGLATGRGFIMPVNASEKLKANFSNIVADFASKNLL